MTKEKIKICNDLYSIAKKQFDHGIIKKEEYRETLYLIRNKISEIKEGFKYDSLYKSINKPIIEVNIKETVNFVLAMN